MCLFQVKFCILNIFYTLGGEHVLKSCVSEPFFSDYGVFFSLCRLFDTTWVGSHYGYQEKIYQATKIFLIAVYVAPKDSLSFRYAFKSSCFYRFCINALTNPLFHCFPTSSILQKLLQSISKQRIEIKLIRNRLIHY